jgi:hypothetical protein
MGRGSRDQGFTQRWVVAVAASAAAAMAAVGCAREAGGPDVATGEDAPAEDVVGADIGEFAATSEYLVDVADATEGQTYRVAVDVAMTMAGGAQGFNIDGTLMTGEVDGEMSHMALDMGVIFDDMAGQLPAGEAPPAELLDGDLSMEMITDGTTLYLRAPFFASLADMAAAEGASGGLGPMGDLAELGDSWGSIDLARVSPSAVASAAGAQSADPAAFLEFVRQADDVHELGTDTIDGEEVRGLGATLSYEDMLAAQGTDIESQMSLPDSAMGPLRALEVPIEVWIDGDDQVRRISISFDLSDMLGDVVSDPSAPSVAMDFATTMTFSDYGDESIEIQVPDASVDLTDAFVELGELGGVGPAGAASS